LIRQKCTDLWTTAGQPPPGRCPVVHRSVHF
jgi:hypothetical protein